MFGSICLHGNHIGYWGKGGGGGIGFTPLSQVLYRFKFKGKKLGSINECIQGNKGFIQLVLERVPYRYELIYTPKRASFDRDHRKRLGLVFARGYTKREN